jgi:hypothetical protein
VPHYPLGTKHPEASEKYDIPFEALQGGAETTYPEYQLKIQKMHAEMQAKKEAAAAARPGSKANTDAKANK